MKFYEGVQGGKNNVIKFWWRSESQSGLAGDLRSPSVSSGCQMTYLWGELWSISDREYCWTGRNSTAVV